MDRVAIIGLMKMELPSDDIRICDGGFIDFDGERYAASDDKFGTVGSMEPISEGVGDEVPAFKMVFLPKSTAAAAEISEPGFQSSRMRFWMGEFDVDTGLVTGTPELVFDGQLDRTILVSAKGKRDLEIDVTSRVERLFLVNEGNTLSPTFHKSIWPGETGHDNAIDMEIPVAWGVEGPASSRAGFSAVQSVPSRSLLLNAY